ncbi:MAG: hypothetical protein HOC71_10410, partial [Candidatus Latescibacteria bacterium]|nr:hypothetical protein [Candidatus Latescibacterota bacterium]
MKRRNFLGAAAGTGALVSGLAGCAQEHDMEKREKPEKIVTDNGTLARKTLEELREEYRYWLLDDYLPFMEKYVIDHEYGGFMCTTDRDGTNINTNKRTWYEGRGIWVYSHLYNTVKQDPKYLDFARKSVEFILKQNPTGK